MRSEIFLARRYLFRGKLRHLSFISVISCIGVMLGVATLIVVMSVMNGFDKELMEKLLRFNYHITLDIEEDEAGYLVSELKNIEGVKSASLFLQTQVFAQFDKLIYPLGVRGIDFDKKEERAKFKKYIIHWEDWEGFFVGEGIKKRFFVGDTLTYYPLVKKPRRQKIKIGGVFRVGLYDVDNNYLVTDLKRAKAIGPNYLLFIGLRLNNPFEAKEVKRRIIEKYPSLRGYTWIEANKALFSALALEKFTMFIILSLIIIVASFNIFANLTVRVVEKTKDIGILKALGFSSRRVLSIFGLQGIMLGLLGTLAGVGVGLGVCYLLKEYHFIRLPRQIYYLDYLPVLVKINDVIGVGGLGVVLSFLSSIFPALKAASLSPVEALRYE